ncbi:MAG: hypothetical protein ACP5N2_04585 [Candidatus Nanoarchaeia archaeon]
MAEITLERLSKTEIEEYASNSLIDYYDVLHKLMEALSLSKGYKIKGEGAHQELIDFVCKELALEDEVREFLQQMREYRNRVQYEGFFINKNYIFFNKEKIIFLINLLFSKLG